MITVISPIEVVAELKCLIARGWTVRALAQSLGVPKSTLDRWIYEVDTPSFRNLEHLTEQLPRVQAMRPIGKRKPKK